MSEDTVDSHLDSLQVGADITAGIGTEFRLQIEGVEARLTSKLVGIRSGEYLIITTPSLSQLGGVGFKLFPGNRVVVRYVDRGTVFGFETSIIEAISSPFQLIFLRAPTVVVDREIRSNRRIHTSLPARIESDPEITGVVTDISISGCHFEVRSHDALPDGLGKVGAEIILHLKLPGVAGEISAKGTLRNVQKQGAGMALGVAFAEMEENYQLAIDEYVKLSD
jgi:hypothetical protein